MKTDMDCTEIEPQSVGGGGEASGLDSKTAIN